MVWVFVMRYEAMGQGYDEYTDESGHYGKLVYFDGSEEVFEI
jgi:hypothetical protein